MTSYGTADHAAQVTEGRHPGVKTALAWLAYSHLPEKLQGLSEPTYQAAVDLLNRIPNDSAELTSALNKLVEAKDWFVRAGIRSDEGKPGPVVRPAAVVDPPVPPTDFATVDPMGDPFKDAFASERDGRLDRTIPYRPARPVRDNPQA